MPLIQKDYPLSSITWMKIGGSADYYAEVNNRNDLEELFRFASGKDLPILYLGCGSNLIISDRGIRGLVIRHINQNFHFDINYSNDLALLRAEGGTILSKLIRNARRKRLNGLDNFVGIPGTIGAAVSGNIGIPEETFAEIIKRVEIYDGHSFRWLVPEECKFRYRGSQIRDKYWFVFSVELFVRKGNTPHLDEGLLERVSKQPSGNSCGSFFKNPDPVNGLYAGKLIDECGLKGKRVGGAIVSDKHANFFINDGSATAKDIFQLACEVKQTVFAKKGILLENEVLVYDELARIVMV